MTKRLNNKNLIKKLLAGLVLFIAATLFLLWYSYAADWEYDGQRYITINLNGGSTGRIPIRYQVDYDKKDSSGNYTWRAGQWLAENDLPIGKTFKDKNGSDHTVADLSAANSHGTPITTAVLPGTNYQHMDFVGTTPYIFIKNPTRSGYDFAGWDINFTNSTPSSYPAGFSPSDGYTAFNIGAWTRNGSGEWDMTITATWTPKETYSIVFNKNGGTGSVPDTIIFNSIEDKHDITKEVPTKNGYTFRGWSTSFKYSDKRIAYANTCGGGPDRNGVSAKITSSTWTILDYGKYAGGAGGRTITLYAQWEINRYTMNITYDSGVSSVTGAGSYDYNSIVTIGVTTKSGYAIDYVKDLDSGAIYYPDGTADFWKWTMYNNRNVYIATKGATYTNSITHWALGFKNGEGNNGDGSAFNIGNTTFEANSGSTYTMNSGKAVTIPNGFYLDYFSTPSISGSWKEYPIPTTVTQTNANMGYNYEYSPKDYSITYNLNGGTNNSDNPSSYNVLYGVSLKAPTKTEYRFDGWYGDLLSQVGATSFKKGGLNRYEKRMDLY